MTGRRRRRRGGRLGRLLTALLFLLIFWGAGLAWFVGEIPSTPQTDRAGTDAIVVLTGGAGRLDEGLKLLDEDKLAERLFVSGVARGVDVATLLRVARRKPGELNCCIAVGYKADNTAGNALETRDWMRENGFRSLRLVTANYHMPRSLVEFRRALPGVRLIPHAVFPPGFRDGDWWQTRRTLRIVASEYNKYLITQLSGLLPPVMNEIAP